MSYGCLPSLKGSLHKIIVIFFQYSVSFNDHHLPEGQEQTARQWQEIFTRRSCPDWRLCPHAGMPLPSKSTLKVVSGTPRCQGSVSVMYTTPNPLACLDSEERQAPDLGGPRLQNGAAVVSSKEDDDTAKGILPQLGQLLEHSFQWWGSGWALPGSSTGSTTRTSHSYQSAPQNITVQQRLCPYWTTCT